MDVDPADGRKTDFRCGPRTEDGQEGTDIAVRDLATTGEGVAVLAAADGEVSRVVDGITDQILTPAQSMRMLPYSCGNMVMIEHPGGWQTAYCHLKKNSTQVRPGDEVHAGQIIGTVGLSGITSWPKLGFTVARNGTPYDPFTGRTAIEGCGLTAESLWRNPQDYPYRAFAIYNLGFDTAAPDQNALDIGTDPVIALPADTPSLSFWATLFDALKGDVLDMRVTDPRGNELMAISAPLPDDLKKRMVSISKERGQGVWESGIYTGTISITRGAGKDRQVSEWSARVMLTD